MKREPRDPATLGFPSKGSRGARLKVLSADALSHQASPAPGTGADMRHVSAGTVAA